MASKKQAEKAISEHGGLIDWGVSFVSGSEKHVVIDAPVGRLWDYSESGAIVISWYCGSAGEFWDEVIAVVSSGTQEAL